MLTDEKRRKIIELIARHQQANTASPELALASLVRDGIYTADGELTVEYGGTAASDRSKQGA